MQILDRKDAEKILAQLSEQGYLFSQFELQIDSGKYKRLDYGQSSYVYEAFNIERPERFFALKIIGFDGNNESQDKFFSTARIQWILSQESEHIMRILASKELLIKVDNDNNVIKVSENLNELWEEENGLRLQLILTEKLLPIIGEDLAGNATLLRKELSSEENVIRFAEEIGEAVAHVHGNSWLHRDIKLENVFWDEENQLYKLGDFGLAKFTDDGAAVTCIYTDGYGAPEIRNHLSESYSNLAEIYSFGMMLYLLLNDMKFPASDGYYSVYERQYSRDFIFPAPRNASPQMATIIRKMCSFYPEDRYQSVLEVLTDIKAINNSAVTTDIEELFDAPTLTHMAEEASRKNGNANKGQKLSRAERIIREKDNEVYYKYANRFRLIVLTFIMVIFFKGFVATPLNVLNPVFLMLPVAICVQALLQEVKEFNIFFGFIVFGLIIYSIFANGFTLIHFLMVFSILLGSSLIMFSCALATIIWLLLEIVWKVKVFDFVYNMNLGWIAAIALLVAIDSYLNFRVDNKKASEGGRAIIILLQMALYLLMLLAGIVLFIVSKFVTMPEIFSHLHLIKVSVISIIFFYLMDIANDKKEQN